MSMEYGMFTKENFEKELPFIRGFFKDLSDEEFKNELNSLYAIFRDELINYYEKTENNSRENKEKELECFGVACDIRGEQIDKINRMKEVGEITEEQATELNNTDEYSQKTAVQKALVIVYDYEVEKGFANKHGLIK